ncbi:peptidase S8/S53 domain-containing protein [Nemania sp. FL0916]|nr:peptidase S8/S53 domain-containing protein [Nemania sp. FL0916]
MSRADAEASALDAYYTAVDNAKLYIKQNLWDEGMRIWERAIHEVEQNDISPSQLNTFRQELINTASRRKKKSLNDDTTTDYSESSDIDDSSDEASNNSPEAENLAMYEDEHKKLYRLSSQATFGPSRSATFGRPRRSATNPIPERRGSAQVQNRNPRNDPDRPFTPRSGTNSAARWPQETETYKRTTSDSAATIPETIPSPVVEASSPNESPKEQENPATRSSAQPPSRTASSGLMGSKEYDKWFVNLKRVHDFVYGQSREFWPKPSPVKVAILDSGFALTGPAQKAMKSYSDRIQDKKTFTTEFPNPKTPQDKLKALDDPVGHGTTVAYQLMETCPSAQVYVAKVTVGGSADTMAVPDKDAVARAIQHAATPVAQGGWGVDIINMSFGWEESDLPGTETAASGVSGAIEFAEKHGVLLFAAATNYGLTQINDVFYPARDPRVVSVDAEDGLGNPAPFALRSVAGGGGPIRYCAPGLSVNSPVSAEPMCGSSFACPVAAGVAGLVLEFVRRSDVSLSESASVKSALSSARGILKVFQRMSKQADNHPGFNMLYPWNLFRQTEKEKVALDIVEQLEKEFGEDKVGKEIRRTVTWNRIQTVGP